MVSPEPRREQQKHSSAEEPITARIRRRTAAIPASDRMTESNVAPEAEDVSSKPSMQDLCLDPPRTFQERIILERRRNEPALTLIVRATSSSTRRPKTAGIRYFPVHTARRAAGLELRKNETELNNPCGPRNSSRL